jgi:hypothetical protein
MLTRFAVPALFMLASTCATAAVENAATFDVAGVDCMGFVVDSLPGVRRAGQIYVDGLVVVSRDGDKPPRLDHEALRRQCRIEAAVVQVRIERT